MITIIDCFDRKIWSLNGKIHRDDGPAVEWYNGSKIWYLHGLRHRQDAPAAVWFHGNKEWFLHGLRHREDGPAIEDCNGNKEWHLHGKLHREDGPAIELGNGSTYWFLHNKRLSLPQIKAHQISRLRDIALALLTFEVPPYVIFWILEWSESAYLANLDQRSVIKMIEGIRNSQQKLKNIFI